MRLRRSPQIRLYHRLARAVAQPFVVLGALVLLALLATAVGQPTTGTTTCPGNCSDRGNCNLETLTCDCPWGYGGPDCAEVLLPACKLQVNSTLLTCDLFQRRPLSCECLRQCSRYLCTPPNHVCNTPFDGDVGRPCFERVDTPIAEQYSAVPASDDAQYIWYARPDSNTVVTAEEGLKWGRGESVLPLAACPLGCNGRGWCIQPMVQKGQEKGAPVCGCFLGYEGQTCGQVESRICLNNCSGNGSCVNGFCQCNSGHFGRDCSRADGGYQRPEGWPHGRGGATGEELKVYIYELPVQLASRQWGESDPNYYAADVFSEMLYKDGQIRTQNPWEATLFFIPALNFYYSSNVGAAGIHMRAVVEYIKLAYPFWNVTDGRDHFFWILGDRNNCYLNEAQTPGISRPIRITHFGFHERNSSLFQWAPDRAVGCFDPMRDIAAAPYTAEDSGMFMDDPRYRMWMREYRAWRNEQAAAWRLHAAAPHDRMPASLHEPPPDPANFTSQVDANRTTLLLFAGSIRREDPEYGGGSRAALMDAVGGLKDPDLQVFDGPAEGNYQDLMWRAKFCFVAYGHGWGIRLRLVVARGCVPVIVQDHVVQYFEDLLPYHHFALRYRTQDMPGLVARLRAIPPNHLKLLQLGLRRHHRAFFWHPRAPVHGVAYNYTILSLRHRLRNMVAGYYRRL